MKSFNSKHFVLSITSLLIGSLSVKAQNSLLVNFGSSTCANPDNPSFSVIKNPLTTTPSVLTDCNVSSQLSDWYSCFVAYNPATNKVFLADGKSDTVTKIWVLDIGLPGNITCPGSIPVNPSYTIPYRTNNFEFDKDGNLWSLNNFNSSTGSATIDKIDVQTGNILASKTLTFPSANLPNSIASGDIVILPNGRFFATLGKNYSRLYEISNYNGGSGNATATYLKTLPANTFGIAYLNGQLEISGTDSYSACYYYLYNIAGNTLSSQKTFQNGRGPIDNTSINPAVGVAKKLTNVVRLSTDSTSARLTYEITVVNTGNVTVNNINVTDDLAASFGAANISGVSVSFADGFNTGGLSLNTAYNGSTITTLLAPGQNLPNQSFNSTNYLFKLLVTVDVSNLVRNVTYNNTAIGQGDIGNSLSLINIADSSNNGDISTIDPNGNGNAGELNENVPTPFTFTTSTLALHSIIGITVSKTNSSNTALVNWTVATPLTDVSFFEVQYSTDGVYWLTAGTLTVNNASQNIYRLTHTNIPTGKIYYRIKSFETDGSNYYSKIVWLNNESGIPYTIFPNPASDFIQIQGNYNTTSDTKATLLDISGRKLVEQPIVNGRAVIATQTLPEGTYILTIHNNEQITTHKILIKRKK